MIPTCFYDVEDSMETIGFSCIHIPSGNQKRTFYYLRDRAGYTKGSLVIDPLTGQVVAGPEVLGLY
jgi:hypothetical protein